MDTTPEIIERPLTRDELSTMYRSMCDDPRYANLPGKIEIDTWGRKLMSPASPYHGLVQARLVQRLTPLGGQCFVEAAIATSAGILVADVAWASAQFMAIRELDAPFVSAPELCIEVVSPSNSKKELDEKVAAYLDAGARETWIVFAHSRRVAFFAESGALAMTGFGVDLAGLFA